MIPMPSSLCTQISNPLGQLIQWTLCRGDLCACKPKEYTPKPLWPLNGSFTSYTASIATLLLRYFEHEPSQPHSTKQHKNVILALNKHSSIQIYLYWMKEICSLLLPLYMGILSQFPKDTILICKTVGDSPMARGLIPWKPLIFPFNWAPVAYHEWLLSAVTLNRKISSKTTWYIGS